MREGYVEQEGWRDRFRGIGPGRGLPDCDRRLMHALPDKTGCHAVAELMPARRALRVDPIADSDEFDCRKEMVILRARTDLAVAIQNQGFLA